MKRFTLTGLTVLTAAALIAVACAQDKPAPAKGHGCSMGAQQHKGLGLSAEQTKKVKALQTDFREKTATVTPALRTKSKALQTLKSAKKPDKAKIATATAEVGKLRTGLQKRQQEYRAAVAKLLTAEQKKTLAASGACPASADPALCPSPGDCDLCAGQCAHHGKDSGSGGCSMMQGAGGGCSMMQGAGGGCSMMKEKGSGSGCAMGSHGKSAYSSPAGAGRQELRLPPSPPFLSLPPFHR
jgi:Spy/CpxP family protein refolding chaperone